MLMLKACGLITVFSVCTALGFLKSAMLGKRAEKLHSFNRGASALAERIRLCSGEIKELVEDCFSEGLVDTRGGGFSVEESYLKKEDIALLNEFFGDLGMGDIAAEYDRTSAYANLIKAQQTAADADCEKLCRLYKSLGALVGIFICIFFM